MVSLIETVLAGVLCLGEGECLLLEEVSQQRLDRLLPPGQLPLHRRHQLLLVPTVHPSGHRTRPGDKDEWRKRVTELGMRLCSRYFP